MARTSIASAWRHRCPDEDIAVETADNVFAADRYELRYVKEIK
ncbi:MAG: hypothetical protein ACRDRY_12140 [Pseudonocardiaceae bacterium]